jgi:hypothetical protein
MRGVIDEHVLSESALNFFCPLFLVFYLTPDRIFVNRLGLLAKFRDLQAAVNWPEHTPE